MNAIADLREQGHEVSALAARIRDLCGDDDLAFADTLDGETDAIRAASNVVRLIAAMETLEGAAKALSDRYKARAQDFASRAERARNALLHFMGDIGEKTLILPEATVTVKAAGACKLLGDADPASLPPQYVRTKLELDKAQIKRAIEAGEDVPGFSLSNAAPSLQIRK